MRRRLRTHHAGRRLLPEFDQRVKDRSGEVDCDAIFVGGFILPDQRKAVDEHLHKGVGDLRERAHEGGLDLIGRCISLQICDASPCFLLANSQGTQRAHDANGIAVQPRLFVYRPQCVEERAFELGRERLSVPDLLLKSGFGCFLYRDPTWSQPC